MLILYVIEHKIISQILKKNYTALYLYKQKFIVFKEVGTYSTIMIFYCLQLFKSYLTCLIFQFLLSVNQ